MGKVAAKVAMLRSDLNYIKNAPLPLQQMDFGWK